MGLAPPPSRRSRNAPTYSLVVSRGYVRLVRRGRARRRWPSGTRFVWHDDDWVEDEESDTTDVDVDDDSVQPDADEIEPTGWDDDHDGPEPADPYVAAAIDHALHPGRGDAGQSARSRMNMRRLFVSLPWELVGSRPALISLTYPGTWQPWVPTGRVMERHRRAFERRWVRRWGEPMVGVWVKEFQESGRPHLHLYGGLPSSMRDEDFAGLRERTLLRKRLERQYGSFEGRRRTPPLGLILGGEFATWVRDAWSEIVGTQEPDSGPFGLDGGAHHLRGVDVTVMFWSDEAAATTDRSVVAQYLAREAGKWHQKVPPPGFEGVGRYYGVWGKSVGFKPEATITPLDPLVAAEVETRLMRWVDWRLRVLREGAPPATGLLVRRPGDGVTAFGLGPEQAARVLRWSQRAAERKRARQRPLGAGGEAPAASSPCSGPWHRTGTDHGASRGRSPPGRGHRCTWAPGSCAWSWPGRLWPSTRWMSSRSKRWPSSAPKALCRMPAAVLPGRGERRGPGRPPWPGR